MELATSNKSPFTLKKDLALERLVTPRPITEIMKEDIYYSVNIEIKELKIQNSNI